MALKGNRHRWDDVLSRVDPTRFESLVAGYFRSQGWSVEHAGAGHTGRSYDGGIDLKLRRAGEYVLVQCKRWTAMQVPHNVVHELIGVMATERATGAMVVTCGEYTHAALEAASREPRLRLVDGAEVRTWIDLDRLEREERPMAVSVDWLDAFLHRRLRRQRITWWLVLAKLLPMLVTIVAAAAFVSMVVAPRNRASHRAMVDPHTVEEPVRAYLRRAGNLPDASRPVDREAARLAMRSVAGVRSSLWLDRENFVVMVDGQRHRTMRMIDRICAALEPLGDTLAVVVNLQDVTAQSPDDATTLSRNCQLPEGERAYAQRNRQVDVVSPRLRATFKKQQED